MASSQRVDLASNRGLALALTLSLTLSLAAACQPAGLMRDGGSGGGGDGFQTSWDARTGDAQHRDGGSLDQPPGYDHVLPRDAALNHPDGQPLRDTAYVDTVIGPPRDAAGVDHAITPPGTQSCQAWQNCAPHYGDPASGYECQGGLCVCDPSGQVRSNCSGQGGHWVAQECYCVTGTSQPPPSYDAGDDEYCWWHWRQEPCEPDYWVDTSYRVYECYCCDSYGDDICEWRWIYQGYWESGYCPPGDWEPWCY